MATGSAATCSACASASAPGARFCMQCGSPLASGCASCGGALPEGARFCPSCGAAASAPPETARAAPERTPRAYTPKHLADKILASRAALEGERKQVTVLFADVRGSMELAEQLDPEQWHAILDRFFAILTDGVHRFEGTVNQYTGDGIMALFGAPLAHEDHAQRACYAALHLRAALREHAEELKRTRGIGLTTRIGLNSGEVVVGKIGDDLRMDYTAQGHVVGLAQRMEALADPGRVYVAAATARLAQGYFALRDLGEFALKGVSAPQHVFELEGVGAMRTRLDVSRARGLSKFVGRAADLATLEGALARAREGQGHVVGIVAEPGVGKSRLCFELLERCRAQGLAVVEGRALSHAKHVPLQTILPLFRSAFGVTELDEPRAAREKIAGRLLLLDESFRELLPLLFDFLGVGDAANPLPPIDPEARQRRLFAALRRIVQSDSGAPRVTLIEDLHWIDAESEAFLAHWVDAIAGTRGVLVLNFRPEYQAEWMRRSHYHQLALAPLSTAAFAELLADLLGTHPSVSGLADQLHARTGGNPFFAEEIVQTLIETGTLRGRRGRYELAHPLGALDVPPTVLAVLAGRIDRLAEREKQLLETAAVIGKEFDEALLAHVAQLGREPLAAALATLERSEFLVPLALFPVAVWAFKHPLTQEVALGAQLGDRKQRTHAAVARALVEHAATTLDERAAEIAQHFEAAEEFLEAARWFSRAGVWLERSGAFERADECAERTAACADRAGGGREATELAIRARMQQTRLSWRSGRPPEHAERFFLDGLERAERLGDQGLKGALLDHRAVVAGVGGDNEGRLRYGREALRLQRGAGDAGLFALVPIAYGLVAKGCMEECAAELAQLPRVPPAEPRGDPRLVAAVLASLYEQRAIARCAMGQSAESLHDFAFAGELTRHATHATTERQLLRGLVLADLLILCGEGAAAREQVRRCRALADEFGAHSYSRAVLGMTASSALLAGDRGAARDAVEEFDKVERSSPTHFRGNFSLAFDEPERIVQEARQALSQARQRSLLRAELEARFALARGLVASGEAESAEIDELLSPVERSIERTGLRVFTRELHEVRALRAGARGDAAGRERELREALAAAQATGCHGHAARLARELGS